eukprot:gene44405-59257_t
MRHRDDLPRIERVHLGRGLMVDGEFDALVDVAAEVFADM